MIKKILVANRGEIALRIQRTAKAMNIETIAVYSNTDKEAAYVKEANEAVLLTGEKLSDTYLNIEKIIAAAQICAADAIHPGDGFLSENADFAEACEKAGIIFIGPPAQAIYAMGNKIQARETAVKAGMPVVPGITGTPDELLKNYTKVGFPLLIKAAAGGGGKGMKIARSEEELAQTLEATAREAKNYFGDATVYIEKLIEKPRHVEVQVLGDQFGTMLHLYERECSLQRRHQKIIEEAPSPTLTPEVRENICKAAVQLAASIGYYNAGTIEFLVDDKLNFYFLEMNTRIQVEHPVTELTTGIDIVEQQIKIASGEKLLFQQKDINQNGHAIECRIYAEDPQQNFMPSPGKINCYIEPNGKDIRVDGLQLKKGNVISGDYDPMISKLIVWKKGRESARNTMIDALAQYNITGIKTNISFLTGLLQHTDYISNAIDTKYIDTNLNSINKAIEEIRQSVDKQILIAAGLAESLRPTIKKSDNNIWQQIGYWRQINRLHVKLDEDNYTLDIPSSSFPIIFFENNQQQFKVEVEKDENGTPVFNINDVLYKMIVTTEESGVYNIFYNGFHYIFKRPDMLEQDITVVTSETNNNDPGNITSPMPGKVIAINVQEGSVVKKGDLLLIVEAMKMENNIISPVDATVEKIMVKEGIKVNASDPLIHLNVN
ncbi:MAG: acetyl-CoA carboxylase biotin carboxylase subunit [Niabella sp.]